MMFIILRDYVPDEPRNALLELCFRPSRQYQ